MKKITENAIHSIFISSAIVDKLRNTKSSHLVDQIEISKEFNSALIPAMLYNYYISICLIRSYDLTDDAKVARQLGSTKRAVADARRKLQKGGWIHFDRFTHKNKSYGHWYIGKDVVTAYKEATADITISKQLQLGLITTEEYELGTSLP